MTRERGRQVCYPQFTNEDNKTYWGKVVCPRLPYWELVGTEWTLTSPGFVISVLCHCILSISRVTIYFITLTGHLWKQKGAKWMGPRAISRGCDSLEQSWNYGYFRYKPVPRSPPTHTCNHTFWIGEMECGLQCLWFSCIYEEIREKKKILEYNWCFIVSEHSRLYL